MGRVTRRRAEWSDLRLFWAVAEAGGFGAAARALGASQSTITRRIDELEHRLNARLFVRGPHGVTLTEAGRMAFDRVLTMERSAEAIENMILNTENAPQGDVGIAAPDGVAGVVLAPAAAEFLRGNPKISLRFDCGLWSEHPLDGRTDLSLTFVEPTHPDLIARPIAHFHYGLFAAQSYLDLYGTPRSLSECTAHSYVHHAAQVHQEERWHPQAAAFRAMVQTRLETNSSAVSLAAIRNGVGLGLLPTSVAAIDPSLVMIDLPHMGALRVWLCYPRDIAQSARIRLVADWITDLFDPRTKPWYREEFIHPREFAAMVEGRSPAGAAARESA
jgi:DNA-binding transcriptional LysR family regulator